MQERAGTEVIGVKIKTFDTLAYWINMRVFVGSGARGNGKDFITWGLARNGPKNFWIHALSPYARRVFELPPIGSNLAWGEDMDAIGTVPGRAYADAISNLNRLSDLRIKNPILVGYSCEADIALRTARWCLENGLGVEGLILVNPVFESTSPLRRYFIALSEIRRRLNKIEELRLTWPGIRSLFRRENPYVKGSNGAVIDEVWGERLKDLPIAAIFGKEAKLAKRASFTIMASLNGRAVVGEVAGNDFSFLAEPRAYLAQAAEILEGFGIGL